MAAASRASEDDTRAALRRMLRARRDAISASERIAAASKVVPRFGFSSECGWGRTDPARVPGLIAAHRQAAEALAS